MARPGLPDETEPILRELAPSQRRALKGVHVGGLQQKQIAQRLGISQSAVSRRMKRIRRHIQQILSHAQEN